MVEIREEQSDDHAAVRDVNDEAFGQPDEGRLVDVLRSRGGVTLSLVAVEKGKLVGHALFSPVEIVSDESVTPAVALGPMAVRTSCQRRGIGSSLVRHGIEELTKRGHDVVVVLGHPSYYPRFGFAPAAQFGISCEFGVPDEVFMALELRDGVLKGVSGTVKYRPEFHSADATNGPSQDTGSA
jgi:putative acetyltransferase